jgi:hypothetical protein
MTVMVPIDLLQVTQGIGNTFEMLSWQLQVTRGLRTGTQEQGIASVC